MVDGFRSICLMVLDQVRCGISGPKSDSDMVDSG